MNTPHQPHSDFDHDSKHGSAPEPSVITTGSDEEALESVAQSTGAETSPQASGPREYETTGCYPENAKPFRMWALFGWLTALIVVLAAVAALLNFVLLDTA